MGATTYNHNKDAMKHSSFRRRIVFTHTPETYKSIPGILEFTNDSIENVVNRLSNEGFTHASLAGGSHLYTQFLEAGLVDDVYLTIEPLTFGTGVPFLTDGHVLEDYTYLQLDTSVRLNEAGTQLLHYLRT